MHFAHFRSCSAFVLALAASACAVAPADDTSSASGADTALTVHTPAGAERKAILEAFRDQLMVNLHGQKAMFNATDPVGRFLAHGDWAYFEGILEGPNDNAEPIDYKNSEYKADFEGGYLEGVQRGGNFAAKFQAVAHKSADGSWRMGTIKADEKLNPAFVVGVSYEAWTGWVSLPEPAYRDIFVSYPFDDVHAPAGAERDAILAALTRQVSKDVHGQNVAFNADVTSGVFLSHDGWAYLKGIVVGPNDNAQPVDYSNSIYSTAGNAFQGVLHQNNFAANVRALFKRETDGSWSIHVSKNTNAPTPGYAVGAATWVGDPDSQFAWDIFGSDGNGNGNGNGDGDGE